jgi:hypothetical protein
MSGTADRLQALADNWGRLTGGGLTLAKPQEVAEWVLALQDPHQHPHAYVCAPTILGCVQLGEQTLERRERMMGIYRLGAGTPAGLRPAGDDASTPASPVPLDGDTGGALP